MGKYPGMDAQRATYSKKFANNRARKLQAYVACPAFQFCPSSESECKRISRQISWTLMYRTLATTPTRYVVRFRRSAVESLAASASEYPLIATLIGQQMAMQCAKLSCKAHLQPKPCRRAAAPHSLPGFMICSRIFMYSDNVCQSLTKNRAAFFGKRCTSHQDTGRNTASNVVSRRSRCTTSDSSQTRAEWADRTCSM